MCVVKQEAREPGMVMRPEPLAPDPGPEPPARPIVHNSHNVLLPTMTIKAAVETFDQGEAEALAVVDSKVTRRVVGLLTEAHALRRYSQESELRRRELLGET